MHRFCIQIRADRLDCTKTIIFRIRISDNIHTKPHALANDVTIGPANDVENADVNAFSLI